MPALGLKATEMHSVWPNPWSSQDENFEGLTDPLWAGFCDGNSYSCWRETNRARKRHKHNINSFTKPVSWHAPATYVYHSSDRFFFLAFHRFVLSLCVCRRWGPCYVKIHVSAIWLITKAISMFPLQLITALTHCHSVMHTSKKMGTFN